MLGAYPFALITEQTPETFEAVRNSLLWREENGQGGMGWAHAHAQLMHARLLEGERAYNRLRILVGEGRTNSLMNTIGPFQIDGNFGATAGIAEMLLQSHLKDKEGTRIIHLLPALPSQWSTGRISGLKARGGFEVAMEWEDGKLISAVVTSEKGGNCSVRYGETIKKVTLDGGAKEKLFFNGKDVLKRIVFLLYCIGCKGIRLLIK